MSEKGVEDRNRFINSSHTGPGNLRHSFGRVPHLADRSERARCPSSRRFACWAAWPWQCVRHRNGLEIRPGTSLQQEDSFLKLQTSSRKGAVVFFLVAEVEFVRESCCCWILLSGEDSSFHSEFNHVAETKSLRCFLPVCFAVQRVRHPRSDQ